MKNISLLKIKTALPEICADVEDGEEIFISSGDNQTTLAVIVPFSEYKKTKKRMLGTLKNKGSVKFADDFAMTDEELLNS